MKSIEIEYLLFKRDNQNYNIEIAYNVLYDGERIGLSRKIIRYGKANSDPDIKSEEEEVIFDIKPLLPLITEAVAKAEKKENIV